MATNWESPFLESCLVHDSRWLPMKKFLTSCHTSCMIWDGFLWCNFLSSLELQAWLKTVSWDKLSLLLSSLDEMEKTPRRVLTFVPIFSCAIEEGFWWRTFILPPLKILVNWRWIPILMVEFLPSSLVHFEMASCEVGFFPLSSFLSVVKGILEQTFFPPFISWWNGEDSWWVSFFFPSLILWCNGEDPWWVSFLSSMMPCTWFEMASQDKLSFLFSSLDETEMAHGGYTHFLSSFHLVMKWRRPPAGIRHFVPSFITSCDEK